MRTLYLHVGQSKTGSSYIQSSLANSMDVLAEAGFEYPGTRTANETGWKISSGNGQMLIQEPPGNIVITKDKILFSAEQLFREMAVEEDFHKRLLKFCEYHNVSCIKGLLFLRDPLPHAESSYHQMIKRAGYTGAIEPFFERQVIVRLVRRLMDTKIGDRPIHWNLWNYDKHQSEILLLTEQFLGLTKGSLERGDEKRVNRSLTAAELVFLRELNAFDPVLVGKLADRLCNELPDVPSEPAYPSHAVQQSLLDKLADDIAAINADLPNGEEYGLDLHDPIDLDKTQAFTQDQLKVIARVIGEQTQTSELHATAQQMGHHAQAVKRAARIKVYSIWTRMRRRFGSK